MLLIHLNRTSLSRNETKYYKSCRNSKIHSLDDQNLPKEANGLDADKPKIG